MVSVKTPAAKARTPKLPAEPTSFVGRRHELHEVKRLLATTRLLTLTGSGGVGKTRLAVSAAAEVARGFPDGVWFAPLAPVQDPLLVPQAIFVALGAQDRSSDWSLVTLADFLAGKRLLLVIDNCEHLLDACAVLASTLLKGCPELHLLATSRQALGVVGEVRMPVPPMSLPGDGRRAVGREARQLGGRPVAGRTRGGGRSRLRRRRQECRSRSSGCVGAWTGSRWRSSWPPSAWAR